MKAALNGKALLAGVLGLCVAAGIGFGVKSNADRQQALAEAEAAAQAAARQEAVEAAATAYRQEEAIFSDLVEEGQVICALNASDLSQVYHQQWEEQQKALPTAGTVTWVSPATGTFNAAAYTGSTGAANIPYWKRQNDDVVGWLRVPGTRTSASASGLSSNTVIYGHNWTNCTASPRVGYSGDVMFAQLTGYHWLSMAQSYPYFYYSTAEGGQFTVKIFACFYTELAFIYNGPEGNMDYIIKEAQRRSRHTFDVDVNSSDKIVTLSTCTRAYGQTSNQRFVVMGRLLRPGETVGPVAISANLNHKQPSVWG